LKNAQRLDYESLAQVLGQRNMVDPQRLEYALQNGAKGPSPFPEVLVKDDLVTDWELSRVVCELYSLPFMPVDFYQPDPAALEGLDVAFLIRHRLVPLARHGDLLTVAMPALVPAEVLGSLAAASDAHVLPLVGTVETNNRWIDANLSPDGKKKKKKAGAKTGAGAKGDAEPFDEGEDSLLPALPSLDDETMDWSNIFDEGDAAVLMDLTSTAKAETDDADGEDVPPPLPPPSDVVNAEGKED